MPNSRFGKSAMPPLIAMGLVACLSGAAIGFLSVRHRATRWDALEVHRVCPGDLRVTVEATGTIESAANLEIKSKVRGENTITWVIESGSRVKEGDLLLTLDTLQIEDDITERTKHAHNSRSGADHWRSMVKRAKIAIEAYKQGSFPSELMTMETDLAISESNRTTTRNILDYSREMARHGYISDLAVEESEARLLQARLTSDLQKNQMQVLKRFTAAQNIERLEGDLRAAEAQYLAASEQAKMDVIRRDLALKELRLCNIHAPRDGLVLHPARHAWEETPDIEEGATVHQEQLLLIMPDTEQMQITIGVHESLIGNVREGQVANVAISDQTFRGTVREVADVARPGGWWTGGKVHYDVTVALPPKHDWRPGKSAKVHLVLADHSNTLTVPTSAVVQSIGGTFVWVRGAGKVDRRRVHLGDTDGNHVIVSDGLADGENVVLTPVRFIDEARREAGRVMPPVQPSDREASAGVEKPRRGNAS